MNPSAAVEQAIDKLKLIYGPPKVIGGSRSVQFGQELICSLNYSKLLSNYKYFFGLSQEIADPNRHFPKTQHGEYTILICGNPSQLLIIPRRIMLEMLTGVPTRKVDVITDGTKFLL